MMALTAAAASKPAIRSLGLCNSIRMTKPRSSSGSTATAFARRRRRRGISSSSSRSIRLGTFLHLIGLHFGCGTRRRRQRRDVAGRLAQRWRREYQRQRDGDGGALVDLALHIHLAAMHGDEAFYDRQAEAGAFVAALIGLAGLEEGIADPLEIVGGDAQAGVGDAQDQPRPLDPCGSPHGGAAFSATDCVGD